VLAQVWRETCGIEGERFLMNAADSFRANGVDSSAVLAALGLTSPFLDDVQRASGERFTKLTPVDGSVLGSIRLHTAAEAARARDAAVEAFARVRELPGPKRGEVARALGDAFRTHKQALGALISLETGKIRSEGEGEVQEMVDIADYACGLSRSLGGRTLFSERADHRLQEQWHPIGPVGVITAFNFPVAVWAWNALIALVCGDSVLWKPSLKAPLTALAIQRIVEPVLQRFSLPGALSLSIGSDDEVGGPLVDDARFPLISATGSVRMGKVVAQRVAARLGRSLLELGGNNALIVLPDADLDLAVRAIVFGAVGTAGQRCTSTRRLLVHEAVADAVIARLVRAYQQVNIGHPLHDGVLMGPLIDADAVDAMQDALQRAENEGARRLWGGSSLTDRPGGCYVEPALCETPEHAPLLSHEVFAPILHVVRVRDLEHAVALNNAVPQGLSSAIFTGSQKSAERFMSARGSDCGLANVNIGTSGAEIGGAFGGEKDSGGGREAGSDSWKAYMRRQTSAINFGDAMPLAQGIRFS
jgi:aldehyde dehydrogenase (NAD+)